MKHYNIYMRCSIDVTIDHISMCVLDTLFAVFEDGTLLKADTCTNPCTVVAEWPSTSLHSEQLSVLIFLHPL